MRPLHLSIALCFFATLFAASAAAQPKGPDQPATPPPGLLLDQDSQISEYIREVFQDRDGVYWFGTNGDGVARFDGAALTYISREQGLGGTASRGILQDKNGALWFGTDGGVSRYENGKFTNYTTAHGLSDNEVWSMMLDKSDTLWVGTQEGVCRFDGKAFVPLPIPRVAVDNPQSRFSPKVVFGMCEDQAGNLWFGTDGEGVHKYDGKSFTSYTTKDGLAGNQVRSAFCDSRGRVWLGTDGGGVSCYDGKSFRNFTSKDGLNNDRIFLVFEDSKSNLWFSTLGAGRGGACRYDGATFTPFGEAEGLTRSHVQSMFEDKNGTLWFGCSGGLFRFDGQSFINVTRNGPWRAPAQKPAAAEPPAHLKALEPLLGHVWEARGSWPNGKSFHIETTFELSPKGDSIAARTYALRGNGSPIHLLDASISYDTGTDRLYVRARSTLGEEGKNDEWGGAYEGDVTVLEGGGVRLELKGYEDKTAVTYDVQLDFEQSGTLRSRIWTVGASSDEHTPMLDVRHTASDMSKSILVVFQDSKNNYWFGSDVEGVYRYDGHTPMRTRRTNNSVGRTAAASLLLFVAAATLPACQTAESRSGSDAVTTCVSAFAGLGVFIAAVFAFFENDSGNFGGYGSPVRGYSDTYYPR